MMCSKGDIHRNQVLSEAYDEGCISAHAQACKNIRMPTTKDAQVGPSGPKIKVKEEALSLV